jgi:hypothetical protein
MTEILLGKGVKMKQTNLSKFHFILFRQLFSPLGLGDHIPLFMEWHLHVTLKVP